MDSDVQRLEEEVAATKSALEKEEKLRKELEALNSKLLSEKQNLLSSLEGEKGELSSIQERSAKLQAQKADLELQLQVRSRLIFNKCESFNGGLIQRGKFQVKFFSKKLRNYFIRD